MITRPTRVTNRRNGCPRDKLYDFNSHKHLLPIAPVPPPGYPFASVLLAYDTETEVRCLWDGGAEATSLSDGCASRIMRVQEGKPPHQCAFNEMGRFAVAQKFWGFTTEDKPSEVDIIGTLRLQTREGQTLPGLRVRMVPGQHDDLLVSARDLDMLGWSRDQFHISLSSSITGLQSRARPPSLTISGAPLWRPTF